MQRHTRKMSYSALLWALSLLIATGCDSSEGVSPIFGSIDADAGATVSDTATTETDDTTATSTEDTAATSTEDTATTSTEDTGTTTVADTTTAQDTESTFDTATLPDTTSSDVNRIHLLGTSITTEGTGVTVSGTTATIGSAGTYIVDGTLSDGQLVVDTTDTEVVYVVFDTVSIHNNDQAPFAVMNAEDVTLVLEAGTSSSLSDTANYTFPTDDDEPNATLFSKDDLDIIGTGTLTIDANYNDAITTKDDLDIDGPTLVIDAVDDGIRGKDSVHIISGTLNVTAGGDGLKSDNDESVEVGVIEIDGGDITVTAGADGLDAESSVIIRAGSLDVVAGGGRTGYVGSDDSKKGIKGTQSIVIDGGTVVVDAADDAIHSNVSVRISDGLFTLASGDDGIHADETIEISGGDFTITNSYEGIEALDIVISGGEYLIESSDDGINAAGGVDNSGGWPGPGGGGSSGGGTCTITGGKIYADADGDGFDVNGNATMSGGTLLVDGPTSSGNGALDYDGTFGVSGGVIVAAGSSGMAEAPSATSSTQRSALVVFTSTQSAGTLFRVEDSSGNLVIAYAPTKSYQSVAFSHPDLAQGQTYTIYLGGTASGDNFNGLYTDGQASGGSLYQSFTISSTVTTIGNAGGPGHGGGW